MRTQVRDDAESNDEEHLRPPGQLAHLAPTPLSITEVLNKVPPFQVGEQIVAEAQRLKGVTSAAVYLVDLEGTTMQRLAGPATFPAQIAVPIAVGPEIPREGIAPLRAAIDELLPGHGRRADVPARPRDRRADGHRRRPTTRSATSRPRERPRSRSPPTYTDHIDSVRRLKPTTPPPRSSSTCSRPGSCASAAR